MADRHEIIGRVLAGLYIAVVGGAILLGLMLSTALGAPRTDCLPWSIRQALATADATCGITVISTHRPGARIAGTRKASMHSTCRAADFTTRQPACVLAALAGWQGKLSTDYGRAGHFHIDDGRYARFAHGYARKRYAKLRMRREAGAR